MPGGGRKPEFRWSESAKLTPLDFNLQPVGEEAQLISPDPEAVGDSPSGGAGEAPIRAEGGTNACLKTLRRSGLLPARAFPSLGAAGKSEKAQLAMAEVKAERIGRFARGERREALFSCQDEGRCAVKPPILQSSPDGVSQRWLDCPALKYALTFKSHGRPCDNAAEACSAFERTDYFFFGAAFFLALRLASFLA